MMDTYLIVGTRNSSRRACILDLIDRGLAEGQTACIIKSASEDKLELDAKLAELAEIATYENLDDLNLKARALDGSADVCFLMADPSVNLADFIEAFKPLTDYGVLRLVRVIGVFDCALYSENFDKVSAYYDAVAHFSDCVILANRSGVEGKYVSAIKKRYDDKYMPLVFQFALKDGKVESPVELLVDEARRISQIFDDYDALDDLELDEDTLPTEPFDITKKADIYLERDDFGQRKIAIPIADELILKK